MSVASISFAENPEVSVHISGGLVDCSDPHLKSHDKMLSKVDSLLYEAKSLGRNQIIKAATRQITNYELRCGLG